MLPDILSYDDTVPKLTWPGAIEALRKGHLLPTPELGDLLLSSSAGKLLNRAARVEGLGFAVKADSIFPGNAAMGLPSVQGAVLLFDASTGSVRAVIDSKIITQYKTAADSLLGAKCLARADSRHLVVIGAGVVAKTLVTAYAAAFPSLERISVWSRRPEQAAALVDSVKDRHANVEAVQNLPVALRSADIILTATMAQSPILKREWVWPGTHVDLIGAYTLDMREADDALIATGRVYVDCMETVMDRIGEIMSPIAAGAIERTHVRGDLYDLVAEGRSSRTSDDEITIFKNGGGAHLDLMIADYVVRAARPF